MSARPDDNDLLTLALLTALGAAVVILALKLWIAP